MGLLQGIASLFGDNQQQAALSRMIQQPAQTGAVQANGSTGLPGSLAPAQNRGLFGDGHINGILGGVGKILTYGPFAGMANDALNRAADNHALNMQYKQAQAAHLADGAADPSIVRTADILGYPRGSDAFRRFVTNAVMAPHYMTVANGDGGQNILQMGGDDGPEGDPPGGLPFPQLAPHPAATQAIPTVTDEASYAQLPSGAQFRDPQGNIRTKR